MDYKVEPSPKVVKYLKKLKFNNLKRKFIDVIYIEISKNPIDIKNPSIERLNRLIWVKKFRFNKTSYRIAYSVINHKILPIILAGSHENFYSNLFKHLKSSAWIQQLFINLN